MLTGMAISPPMICMTAKSEQDRILDGAGRMVTVSMEFAVLMFHLLFMIFVNINNQLTIIIII